MIRLSVREIARVTGGRMLSTDEDVPVSGFCTDSRTMGPGQFFIALKGKNFDGHDHIREAVARGARGIIAERMTVDYGAGRHRPHIIIVENTLTAMGQIAGHIRRKAGIPVVCITGTNGKTTVKDILSHLLSFKYRLLKSRGSFNNLIGVSLTLFELEPSHEMAVIELGSNHPGEIAHLARITAPRAAVITNIGHGHLEFFGGREGVFREKVSLLERLPDPGAAFLNGDDDYLSGVRIDADTRFFGRSRDCDLRITGIRKQGTGHGFDLDGERFFVPLEGEHNVYNAAAAVAAAAYFGMDHRVIRERLSGVSLPRMRLEKIVVDGILFINDACNAN
ncbi:MAG: UDP-N-acetylmuramoyl-tripeptide--D-alanyl-D-alanine ligase, partial [Candidatus Omnitrophica bacterium]|nr:UDP-N-acetylmuramoyl-tripeptide--D-alanyl-D-alanine ligase [Candidatus Omnitrophota bacterium]